MMVAPVGDFDPDATGSPVDASLVTRRVCPLGHTREHCTCPLRPEFWGPHEPDRQYVLITSSGRRVSVGTAWPLWLRVYDQSEQGRICCGEFWMLWPGMIREWRACVIETVEDRDTARDAWMWLSSVAAWLQKHGPARIVPIREDE